MNNEDNCKTIDMHCDTLMRAYFRDKDDLFTCPEFDLDGSLGVVKILKVQIVA